MTIAPSAEVHLDCRGLCCPMPIVRVSRAMKSLTPGQSLQVSADDPAFSADIQAWISMVDAELLWLGSQNDIQSAVIRKR